MSDKEAIKNEINLMLNEAAQVLSEAVEEKNELQIEYATAYASALEDVLKAIEAL